jgi:signal transduction histidine kinase
MYGQPGRAGGPDAGAWGSWQLSEGAAVDESTGLVQQVLAAPFSARTRREIGYAFAGLLLAVPAFVVALLCIVFTVMSLLTVGLPFLTLALLLARRFIRVFRWPARALLGRQWELPARIRARNPVAFSRAVLTDPRSWRAFLYCLIRLPLAVVTVYLVVLLGTGGLFYLAKTVWRPALNGPFGLDFGPRSGRWGPFLVGVAALLLLPWVLRILVGIDRLLTTGLLAPSRAQERIARLESSRIALTDDAVSTLRRVERDLHDGTQARLVVLGVTLSRLSNRLDRQNKLDEDIDNMIVTAQGTVTEALTELREIVRGMHPPALDDGLPTALETLAARSSIPVELNVSLRGRPSDTVATAIYFTVTELLANAIRHAAATRLAVSVTDDDHVVRLIVIDDGRGGARSNGTGTGLAGLRRRAEALDGVFEVVSPVGGPTVVTVVLPRV